MSNKNSWLCIIFIINTSVCSQAIVPNQNQLESLSLELQQTITLRNTVSTKLDSLNYRLDEIKLNISYINNPIVSTSETANIIAQYSFPLLSTPSFSAPKLSEITEGTELTVYNEYDGLYVKASYMGRVGYVATWRVIIELPKSFKDKNAKINKQIKLKKIKEEEALNLKRAETKRNAPRRVEQED